MPTEKQVAQEVAQQVVERVGDPILIVRSNTTIAYVNAAACELLGYSKEELLDKKWTILAPEHQTEMHDAEAARFWAEPKSAMFPASYGFELRHKDGYSFPVEIRVDLINAGRDLVVVIVRRWYPKTPLVGWPRIIKKVRLVHLVSLMALFAGAVVWLRLSLPPPTTFWILNTVLISIGVFVLVAYINAISDAFRNRRLGVTAGHMLAMGLFLNWLGIIMRQFGWYFGGMPREAIEPLWLITLTASLLVSIMGGLLHLTAVEAVEATWAPKYLILSGLLAALGVGLSLTFGWLV